jgi:hypothetical protein
VGGSIDINFLVGILLKIRRYFGTNLRIPFSFFFPLSFSIFEGDVVGVLVFDEFLKIQFISYT